MNLVLAGRTTTQLLKNCCLSALKNTFSTKDGSTFKRNILIQRINHLFGEQSPDKDTSKFSEYFGQTNKKNRFGMATFTISGGCLSLKKKRQQKRYENRNTSNAEIVSEEEISLLSHGNIGERQSFESPPFAAAHDKKENSESSLRLSVPDMELGNPKNTSQPMATDLTIDTSLDVSTANCEIALRVITTVGEPLTSVATVTDSTEADKAKIDNERINTMTSPLKLVDQKDKIQKETFNVSEKLSSNLKAEAEKETKSGKKRKSKSDEEQGVKKRMDRPNYFVAIQVSDPTIQENLKNVQDHIIQEDKRLKPALIPIATLHLTLLIVGINDNEELERASDALRKCYDEVKNDFTENPLHLEFEGLSSFKNQVVFAKIKYDTIEQRIKDLGKLLVSHFEDSGISPITNREVIPHLTILKLPRKGKRCVRYALYKQFSETYFGQQTVNSLQLLGKEKSKTEAGYWHCEKEYHFVPDKELGNLKNTSQPMATDLTIDTSLDVSTANCEIALRVITTVGEPSTSVTTVTDSTEADNAKVDNERINTITSPLKLVDEKETFNVSENLSSNLKAETEKDGTFLFDETKSGKKRKSEFSDEKQGVKKRRNLENYIVAIQVSDPTIQENLKNVQDHIIQEDNTLKRALIPIATLHLTLLVVRINDEELERASDALRKCYDEVKNDFTVNPLHLEFEGLSHFKNQVLFANIKYHTIAQRIKDLAKLLVSHFEDSGISQTTNREVPPHLTILKLRRKGMRCARKALYEEFSETYFGQQTVNSLQLLSLQKPKTEAGYYQCEKEYHFDFPNTSCKIPSPFAKESECFASTQTKEEVEKKFSSITKAQLEEISREYE